MLLYAILLAGLIVVLSILIRYWWSKRTWAIEGTVVLVTKDVLGYNNYVSLTEDDFWELIGQGHVSIQLVSSTHSDHANADRGIQGKPSFLENWAYKTYSTNKQGESTLKVHFDWERGIRDIDDIGAIIVKNTHSYEFFLKTVTLQILPILPIHPIFPKHPTHRGIRIFANIFPFIRSVHFVCNSWIYPPQKYSSDRIFFTNKALLPSQTPDPLVKYRNEELANLRGDDTDLRPHGLNMRRGGAGHMRKDGDRIYEYACYNDLGHPDKSRKVLGGSVEYPYPRRVRTGRALDTDSEFESRLPLLKELNIYVPRDEMFGHLKMSDFLGNTILGIIQSLVADVNNFHEFNTYKDVVKLFEGDKDVSHLLNNFTTKMPNEISTEILTTNKAGFFKFPMPQVIQADKYAWTSDEEFAREMLAGVNPVNIRSFQGISAASQLNQKSLTERNIGNNVNGFILEEAITNKKLFILDHHGTIMPFLRRINETTTKTYATRTLLYLQGDGTLMPLAIELSLPHPDGDDCGEISKVYTPAESERGVEDSIWQLAKAYVSVNDSGVHQLISHWLNTHAVIEPFIIATNRQLSSLHPIYRLLLPHFRDTMYINALARQVLINADGIIESTFFPGKYAMEMSSAAYKNWVFPDQALPADLIKRGMAVADAKSPHGVKLIIEDYPYAVDGLEIWSAIEKWVKDYCACYYKNDDAVQNDRELHDWWQEVVNEGHGDKKDETWWPKMKTISELTESCTIIIWVASALHAAVNFGQYDFAGYPPNRPTLSRKLMPEPGTSDYDALKDKPEKVFLETITDQWKSIRVISIVETLSKHCSDEVYLGNPISPMWTGDKGPQNAFKAFGEKLEEIKSKITALNNDETKKNRAGLAEMPYTLLYPSSEKGLTGKGIPNSVSI